MPIRTAVVAVSALCQRPIDAMETGRFDRETRCGYRRDLDRFATVLGRLPDMATAEDARRLQGGQGDLGAPVPTVDAIVPALRFSSTRTLAPRLGRIWKRCTGLMSGVRAPAGRSG